MDDEEPDDLVTILARPSERSAQDAARRLVERGFGAVVEAPAPAPAATDAEGRDGATTTATGGYSVRVMRHEVQRACEVLGVQLPEGIVVVAEEEKEPGPPWKRILLIWAIAMVTIPPVAGLCAYVLFNR